MVENRPVRDFFAHAVLITGVLLVAFPLWVTFVASTLTFDQIVTVPMPLWPGDQFLHNYTQVLTAGSEVRRYVLDATAGISTSVVAMLPEKDETGNLIFRGIVAGDLNGDGLSDALVVGRQQNVSPSTFAITCDRTARWDIATGTFPDAVNSLRAIDFDGDGRTEVLARTATDAVVYAIQ